MPKINLKKDTQFSRTTPSGAVVTRTVAAGEEVTYSKLETAEETVWTATTTLDGYRWQHVVRQPAVAVVASTNAAPAATAARVAEAPAVAPAMTQESLATTEASTANAVARVVARRHVDHGSDAMERGVNRLQAVVKELTGDVYMVMYDICDSLKNECPNPSHTFWRFGFRLNLSCWVMPQKGLDSGPVQEVLKHWKRFPGVKCEIIPYHPRAIDQIRAIAVARLDEELRRIHTALVTRLGTASDRLKDAEETLAAIGEPTEKDVAKPQDAYVGAIRATLRDAIECFANAISCAEAFDETAKLADLFDGLRQAIRAEATAFNAKMRAQKRKPVAIPASIGG